MKCAGCGNETDERGRFCGFCGKELYETSYCQKCGRTIPSGGDYCIECMQKKGSGAKKIVAVVVVIVVFLLTAVGGVGWYMWKENQRKNEWKPQDYDEQLRERQAQEKEAGKKSEEQLTKKDKNKGKEQLSEPYFKNVKASSEFEPYTTKSGRKLTYYVEQLEDNKHETAWSPAEDDRNPWIKFEATSEQRVSGIRIENGYSKTEDLYYQNKRAKDIIIECDGFKASCTLEDRGCQMPETIKFKEPVVTDFVKITIRSTYDSEEIDGEKYEELCISEIDIF